MPTLTTTSYAVLGFLCVRPATAYDLEQQMRRNFRYVWPRARSGLYEEPKKLVALGLATASKAPSGRRNRTVYKATAKGRRAFRAWLGQPSDEPHFESEALVRLTFAEHGTRDDLLATLYGLRDQAERFRDDVVAQGHAYLDGGFPFPERAHLNALFAPFITEYATMLVRYARWAVDEVGKWPDVDAPLSPAQIDAIVRGALARSAST
jgi:DNA-binding PadR family transcriptional regulator